MKKLLVLSAAAALVAVQTASAVPTLTLSDNNGHSVTITDDGVGDDFVGAGVVSFHGVVGNWTINVTTGIAQPPGTGIGNATHPYVDLASFNQFAGGAGGTLTIKFSADGVGPISGRLTQTTGGTLNNGIVDEFSASVNGTGVTDETFTSPGFAGSNSGTASGGANSTIVLTAVLKASGTTAGTTSFDSEVSVPDAGMTLALLGSALTGLALFARSRKTA